LPPIEEPEVEQPASMSITVIINTTIKAKGRDGEAAHKGNLDVITVT